MYQHTFLIIVRVSYPNITYKGKDKTEESVKNTVFF